MLKYNIITFFLASGSSESPPNPSAVIQMVGYRNLNLRTTSHGTYNAYEAARCAQDLRHELLLRINTYDLIVIVSDKASYPYKSLRPPRMTHTVEAGDIILRTKAICHNPYGSFVNSDERRPPWTTKEKKTVELQLTPTVLAEVLRKQRGRALSAQRSGWHTSLRGPGTSEHSRPP